MQVHAPLIVPQLGQVRARVEQIESQGFSGVFSFEGPHNPFLPLVLAAEHSNLEIMTGVAIAFARTPMTVANLAWDLQEYSAGRLSLGLATQIRPHIEARYSMPWSKPVSRMKEFVAALHAIFACWQTGDKLNFRGDFYTHTLMPPLFKPNPLKHPAPPIILGGVGPKMLAAAGEVADGILVHPFHTAGYLRDIAQPAIRKGSELSCREAPLLRVQVLVVTGPEAQRQAVLEATRMQVAFYASTPAYAHVLAAEGMAELQPELRTLTKTGGWAQMPALIPDELLHKVALVGSPQEVAAQAQQRYGGLASHLAIATPYPLDPDAERELVGRLQELT